jgi:hypothetical protein
LFNKGYLELFQAVLDYEHGVLPDIETEEQSQKYGQKKRAEEQRLHGRREGSESRVVKESGKGNHRDTRKDSQSNQKTERRFLEYGHCLLFPLATVYRTIAFYAIL